MKNATSFTALIALALIALAAGTATATEGVSPGATDRLAQVNDVCPTFSWGAEASAAAYELVAYVLPEEPSQPVELTADREVLFTRVAGGATSWTPSAEQCFAPAGRYLWFVRAVQQLAGDQVIEAGEWSAGRTFEVSAGPTAEELARAVEVLKRWEAMNGGGSPTLFAVADAVSGAAAEPAAGAASDSGAGAGGGAGANHRKAVPTAQAAIRGEHPDTTGEVYGVIGTSESAAGAGIGAANMDGGPDLLLDGSANGHADTRIWEYGIDRSSATDESFSLSNSGAGRLHLDVNGDIFGDTIDIEEVQINGSTVIDDTGEWTGTGSTVPCPGCVGSSDIADGAVDSADLASASVTSGKIAAGAVGASAIHSNAVTTTALADAAVTAAKLAPGAVGSAVLGPDSVESSHIVDGAVATADLADSSVTYRKLANDAVRSSHIRDGEVGTSELSNAAVTSSKLSDGAVINSKLGDFSITSTKIGPSAIDSVHIADQAVQVSDIAAGAVISSKIADGAVHSSKIADGSITSDDVTSTGGIFSSASSMYAVSNSKWVTSSTPTDVSTACSDANDLPFQGGCSAISGPENLVLVASKSANWTVPEDPGEHHCTYYRSDSGASLVRATIYCIEVD